MKKQFRRIAALVLAIIFVAASACACAKDDGQTNDAEYTITFMNGEETLGTATVKEGQVLGADDYSSFENREGYEFNGWFETPTFLESSAKDLTKDTFDKDTTLYGSFKSTNVAEDTRVWYIVGESSKGPLADSKWAGGDVEDSVKEEFELKATGENVNEFSITIDLYADDMFQIIHDWAWDGQKGYGCFTSIDDTQMENAGGLGGTSETSNVKVLMDGNYTITLTTDPDNSAQDTIEVVRNSEPVSEPREPEEEEPYTVSDSTEIMIKGGWVDDWSDIRSLTREEGTNVFTITMDLDAGTEVCFMVYDNGEDTGIVLKEANVTDDASLALMESNGNNIQVSEAGSYTFTVDADAMSVTLAK